MTTKPFAVIAPSGAYNAAKFETGMALLTGALNKPNDPVFEVFPNTLRPYRYLASSDSQRLAHLNEALTSGRYSGVLIIRGGYGITRVLHGIDWPNVKNIPVLGFSDVTALHMAMKHHQRGVAVHSPMPHSLLGTSPEDQQHLFRWLQSGVLPALEGEVWIEGSASGPLYGGNLCMLASLCGTPWQPDFTGSIVLLEEIGEPAYKIDRMLQQLISAGVFKGVAAVVLGEFASCRVPEEVTWSLKEVLFEHLSALGVPVLANLPVGHGSRNRLFVQGTPTTLHQGVLRPPSAAKS